MAAGTQDGTIIIFSIDGGGDETYGMVQNDKESHNIERKTAMGNFGHIESTREHNDLKTLTLNFYILGTPVGTPTIGTVFTYKTIEWKIDTIDDGRTIDGFETYDITATHYPHLT